MKRMIAAVVGVALTGLMGSVGVLAQDKAAGSVYYGCLVPGSTNDSFKLIKASEKGQKGKEKANYDLVADPKLDVLHFVTMEVEVTGSASGTTLTVSKIKRRSEIGRAHV